MSTALLQYLTILLCVHDRIYAAKGFLRPQNSLLFAQIERHQLFPLQTRNCYSAATLCFCEVTATVSRIKMQASTFVMNEFPYVPCDTESWAPLNTTTFVKCKEPTTKLKKNMTCEIMDKEYTPRIASSALSAQTILNEWIQEDRNESWSTEWKAITYFDDSTYDPSPLYGYLIRNSKFYTGTSSGGGKEFVEPSTCIILFPTAVGAQDLFLFYKAAQIANHPSLQHCTIMIADLFSDPTGWLWDKTNNVDKYNSIREDLLRHNIINDDVEKCDTNIRDVSCRPLLQKRINAAFSYVNDLNAKDTVVTAAMGWCFGGHCIAELARMSINVQAMVTFHGVFSGLNAPFTLDENSELPRRRQSEILICHGLQDPFVPSEDLEKAL
jgi:dienelactone hydrolase